MALRRYWFQRSVGFGYGVTAPSAAEAQELLRRAGLVRDWIGVVEDIDVSTLDAKHVLPNAGPPNVMGIWYPALNLSNG